MKDLSITETKEISISKLQLEDSAALRNWNRSLEDLKESIDAIGLIQPISVFKNEIDDDEGFTVVLGSRRFLASCELGYSKIFCHVFNRVVDRDEVLSFFEIPKLPPRATPDI